MKINLKIFYILILLLMFLPSFRLNLGSIHFLVFFIVLIPLLILSFCAGPKLIIRSCKKVYKYTPGKFLFYFILWLIISGCFLMILGYYNPLHFLNVLIMTLLCLYIMPYILPSIILPKILNFRTFIKGYIFSLFVLFIIGIVFYIGYKFNIGIIKTINHFFCNARLAEDTSLLFNETATRAAGFFEEPGWYSEFIFLNLPFIYAFSFSKKNLFSKLFTNLFFKTTLIPLAYISLLLTKSPIWIIFSVILTVLYVSKNYIQHTAKHPFKIVITSFIFFITVYILYNNITSIIQFLEDNTLTASIATRIKTTLYTFGSFEKFVLHENSLATRVISYMAAFKLFISHIITGVGWINSQYHILPYLMQLKVPFSEEIVFHINMSQSKGSMHLNASILTALLSESGIVGTFLFYLFLFKTVQYTQKISNFYSGFEKIFINSLAISYISMIAVSFYTGLLFICYPLWFYLGLINPFILNLTSRKYIIYSKETDVK